jgi:putative endonuclease
VSETAHARGLAAENAASALLERKGFVLIARRYKTPHGEIDLIARKGDLLVFVEVKQRSGLTRAAESITPRQRQRIVNAAEMFLSHPQSHGGHDLSAIELMRFDAILVASGRSPLHIEAAFTSED